ncbi:efflux RND transporter periplasmic adaptor subunit [Solitalea sp. MAHUQ-68]|uniref:Efflux RND transporter periplasmic adaptor subunit n=1 Tax=Solitalea agri TaxID=2953739 RepID=A0A9X2JEP0_9SPHI|nr:efflux RND transporter periplasmic adaptor subunit [Solitalea agri]MCO4294130.1 efflux RND transporter periplasmic adaptor subunit [Solitalea agri]
MNKKYFIYGAVIIAAFALISWKLNSNKKSNEEKTAIVQQGAAVIPVQAEKVTKTVFARNFVANGTFAPVRELSFVSENSGRITSLLVDEGSFVSKGQVIARIDGEILNADVQAAQTTLDQLRKDRERYESALQSGGVTQKQVDDVNFQIRQAESRMVTARRKMTDTQIKAPISGVINKKYVELGSYLSPGTKLFDIVDVSTLKLNVTVPETQVVNLKLNANVNVECKVFAGANYTGKITFIAAKGDNTLNYPVEIEVTNLKDQQIKAGMYGTANFSGLQSTPGILIPRGAFVGGVNSNQVFVEENGVAKLRKVVAGQIMGDKVVVENGLNEGETVITSGQINLNEGTKVEVQK